MSVDGRKIIRRDPRVSNLLTLVKNEGNLDISSLMNAVEQIHSTRILRNLSVNAIYGPKGTKHIAKALLQNQAYRSRVVEIKMSVSRQRVQLEQRYNLVYNYIQVKHVKSLSAYRSLASKDQAIAYILEPVTELLAKYSNFEEYCDEIIKDLDQGGWTIKHLIDAANIEIRA